MGEDDLLAAYGTHPNERALGEIRGLLDAERAKGSTADTPAMKLLCVQLFNAGNQDDVLRIWKAKESSFDASCSIDVQLLCGAGLEATRNYLAAAPGAEAKEALAYLIQCLEAGDFEEFDPARQSAWYDSYYGA
jgi:hypothetical protein